MSIYRDPSVVAELATHSPACAHSITMKNVVENSLPVVNSCKKNQVLSPCYSLYPLNPALMMSPRLVMKRLQSNCQARRTDQQSISAPELPIFHNIADSLYPLAFPLTKSIFSTCSDSSLLTLNQAAVGLFTDPGELAYRRHSISIGDIMGAPLGGYFLLTC
ncbi:hypothetical protein CSKR_113085 [Clonorchis sinensis]|uniref:Uncharacterized protein n=1 Tax=Clonorchis sinensis TaxID=79923 RepID=A0A3R7CCL2_CLOSI|nr:hypothetical protein CSKR_113085 [Clonorchis sinensis]